jgi:hypothetical protein
LKGLNGFIKQKSWGLIEKSVMLNLFSLIDESSAIVNELAIPIESKMPFKKQKARLTPWLFMIHCSEGGNRTPDLRVMNPTL